MRKSRMAIGAAAGIAGAILGTIGWRSAVRGVMARDGKGRMRGTWRRVDGLRLFARVPRQKVSPSAVPVVLVHGAVISSSYMIPLAVRLAPDFPVWALDLPGHGESDAPERPMRIEELADALIGWLDAVGLERAALVANSMGCQVAARAAARHPERVDRLVLIGPTTDPAARTPGEQLAALLRDARHERGSLILLESQAILDAGWWHARAQLRMAVEDRIEEALAQVTAPTLVVRGEHDPLVSRAWALEVARIARAAEVLVIPDTGHAPHYSAPDAVASAIRPFLSQGQAEPEARALADLEGER